MTSTLNAIIVRKFKGLPVRLDIKSNRADRTGFKLFGRILEVTESSAVFKDKYGKFSIILLENIVLLLELTPEETTGWVK